MKSLAIAFVAGALFAVGLALGGMLDTGAVVGFLDLADWNPRLVFVMAGAIGVMLPVHRVVLARAEASALATVYHLPTLPLRDPRLVVGAVLFGAGWALVGYCPGPAIVSLGAAPLGLGAAPATIFAASMLAGMVLFRLVEPRLRPRRTDGIDA